MQKHLYVCDHCHTQFTTALESVTLPTTHTAIVNYDKETKIDLDLCNTCFTLFTTTVNTFKNPPEEEPDDTPTNPPTSSGTGFNRLDFNTNTN